MQACSRFSRVFSSSRDYSILRRCFSSNMDANSTRFNAIGIQMLSHVLHDQLFRSENDEIDAAKLAECREHLKRHDLRKKTTTTVAETNFRLPSLEGENLDAHFRKIASDQNEPYLTQAKNLVASKFPPMPEKWNFSSGWTRYDSQTGKSISIDYPLDEGLVFDVEVCVPYGPMPVLAVAASPQAWYSWTSDVLVSRRSLYGWLSMATPSHLIPLETVGDECEPRSGEWLKRLIVGHSVSYDRARIKEQYYINNTRMRFLDTLSLHMCVAGLTSYQRGMYMRKRPSSQSTTTTSQWKREGTLNSLEDVYQFYVGDNKALDKSPRDVFVKGNLDEISDKYQCLMTYCARDVAATHDVFRVVFPRFLQRMPHPVTLAGMLEMGTAYLPVDSSWIEYINNAERSYNDLEMDMKRNLMKLADEALNYGHGNQFRNEPWLCNLDWKVPRYLKKRLYDDDKERKIYEDDFDLILGWRQHLPGYPNWYRKLCPRIGDEDFDPVLGPSLISAQNRTAPCLLRLSWDGHPLYYLKGHGWGCVVPIGDNVQRFEELLSRSQDKHKIVEYKENVFLDGVMSDKDFDDLLSFLDEDIDVRDIVESSLWLAQEMIEDDGDLTSEIRTVQAGEEILVDDPHLGQLRFLPLPHKDGAKNRVGNPLAKAFLSKMEDGTLKSESGDFGRQTLKLNKILSFWRNAKKRISNQFVVWLGPPEKSFGVILPQLRVAGTVTRRAVEATWLTASNAKEDRLGSEQKAMIRAPSGYHFVGADVDSQELWIAAILGDAHFAGLHGSTAFGWMTLQGKKVDGTDLHSKTASTVGISRDHAKVFNYGRIYGAGVPFAIRLLRQFNHQLTEEEAAEKARQLYASTKGRRRYVLTVKGIELCLENGISFDERAEISAAEYWELKKITRTRQKLFSRLRWSGGSESEMFNKLETVVSERAPQTPVLGCRISQALDTPIVGGSFKTSRINWVVQSSAVDYLHLLLVSMRWLFEKYGVKGQFCISIHDEVRYLVQSEDRYQAALALQISNLLTRAMFAHQLGMNDLPQSVAFFSAVDIDRVLRKEVTMDCKTPSNPHGLHKGHGIDFGEAVDIYEILKATNNGSFEK